MGRKILWAFAFAKSRRGASKQIETHERRVRAYWTRQWPENFTTMGGKKGRKRPNFCKSLREASHYNLRWGPERVKWNSSRAMNNSDWKWTTETRLPSVCGAQRPMLDELLGILKQER